ncbi:hypothetical protein MRB53_020348 [Persea americana]|uniref:Uncharacterized protein n=1 Tax=Persea americana TaxID=3435 RepID=A0ACC2L0J4_PERAE|nr:hypothetical protein MRB53_020348 [Persea americana]
MLSAAPFSSPTLSSTTTPICRPHAVLPVVSAKIPISRGNHDHVHQDQHMGGLAFSALSTLKSSSSSSKSYTPRKHNNNNNKSSSSIEEKGPSSSPLSGSDVLLALQRAAADKASTKMGKKGKRMGSKRGVEQRPSPTAIADYSDVRPLNIRSDWGDRLDEMERLLQELQMEDEAHRH